MAGRMEDAFFDGETEHSDWLKLIDEAVGEAMEQFDIDSLAPTGTPKDWIDLVDEVMEWSPFEEIITHQFRDWRKENDRKKRENASVQNQSDGGDRNDATNDNNNHGNNNHGNNNNHNNNHGRNEGVHVIPPPFNYEDLIVEKSEALLELKGESMGRFVEARRVIEAGEILVEEAPFASMLRTDARETHCTNCYKRMTDRNDVIACHRCSIAKFCSSQCLEEATAEFHQFECPFIKGLFTLKIIPLSLRMLLRGWRNIMYHFLYINGMTPRTPKPRVKVPTEEGLAYDMKVVPGRHCYQHAIAAKLVLEMAKQSGLLNLIRQQAIHMAVDDDFRGCEHLLQDHLDDFLKCVIFVNIHKIKFNSFEIHEYQVKEKEVEDKLFSVVDYQRVGAAMYPTTSLINHSCRPNANFFFRNSHIVVKSNQKIAKGDQVFISYGPTVMSIRDTRKRRRELMANYGFLCKCPNCCLDHEGGNEEDEDEGDYFGLGSDDEDEEDDEEEEAEAAAAEEEEESKGSLRNIVEAYNLEQQIREYLSYAFDAIELLQFEGAAAALLKAKGCCLEIEEILGKVENNPQKEENEKCAFNLLKEVDEFIVMSYGLLGNKHIMLTT